MAKPDEVYVNKHEMKALVGYIYGYGEAAEEVEHYIKNHLGSEGDRSAVASVPRLAKQWDELSEWRRKEAKRLIKLFHGTSFRIAKSLANYLHEDIEAAAHFPSELLTDESPIGRELMDRAERNGGDPVETTTVYSDSPRKSPPPAWLPSADGAPRLRGKVPFDG